MLTRARSLFSRVFSFDTHSSSTRLDDVLGNVDDQSSDDNDPDNYTYDDIDDSIDDDDNDDEEYVSPRDIDLPSSIPSHLSSTSTKIKGKYERQINESPKANASPTK